MYGFGYTTLISSMSKGVSILPIITNGLVVNLDAGNTASYSGTGTTWTDLSGNSRNGTLVNGTSYSSANGGSLIFDGINDYVAIANLSPIFNGVTNFSIDMWIKVPNPSSGAFNSIFSYGFYSNYGNDLFIYITSNKIGIQVNNGGDGGGECAYTSSNFSNIQVIYNGTLTGNTNRLKLYINGVEQTLNFGAYTVPSSTTTFPNGENAIGAYSTPGYNNFLNGNVSVMRVYNKSLTASEVTTNFNAIKSRYGL